MNTPAWFTESPESNRALAEERAVLEASEVIMEALLTKGISRKKLADALGISRSEITQRLSGERNLTIRSLAAMLHELDYDLHLAARDRHAASPIWHSSRHVTHDRQQAASNRHLRLVRSAA